MLEFNVRVTRTADGFLVQCFGNGVNVAQYCDDMADKVKLRLRLTLARAEVIETWFDQTGCDPTALQ